MLYSAGDTLPLGKLIFLELAESHRDVNNATCIYDITYQVPQVFLVQSKQQPGQP